MKLKEAHIENFKIVEDSTPFIVDQVTCLVGKNESGKSAILEALYKIKPVEADKKNFTEFDFPRRRISQIEESGSLNKQNVVTTTWELEAAEIEVATKHLGFNPFASNQVVLKKGYSNVLVWEGDLACQQAVDHHISASKLNETEKDELKGTSNTSELFKRLKAIATPSEAQAQFLAHITTTYPAGSLKALMEVFFEQWPPTFVYFTEYYRMAGKVALPELKRLQQAGTLKTEDKVFLAFLDLANTTIEEFENVATTERLFMKLEAVSNRISEEIFEYWTQNQYLNVQFRYDQARPQDPAPYNSGYIFNTRIENTRHKASVGFDERSTGFIWFFSFLVWFSQIKKNYGKNLFILLDEPGLALHAKAQADLLRYIEEKLKPNYQVVYSTHSPFMIDAENLLSARTVEDTTSKDSRGREVVEGTKVGSRVLSTDSDTLLPLQGALGYDISQSLFVGPNTLLVEGPSDILYLKAVSAQLAKLGRTFLNPRWTICPAGGLDKVISFVILFSGKIRNIAVLTDMGSGDKSKVRRLREHELLKSGRVFSADEYANQDEADVEDLIGRAAYIELVRHCYSLAPSELLPHTKPDSVSLRCVKEVEDHMRLLTNKPNFDHFMPAQYFLENITTLSEQLPEWDMALDRFEVLFTELNALLSA